MSHLFGKLLRNRKILPHSHNSEILHERREYLPQSLLVLAKPSKLVLVP